VIASSGAGNPEHFVEVFERTGAEAALAAGIFHRREVPIDAVKARWRTRAVAVRRDSPARIRHAPDRRSARRCGRSCARSCIWRMPRKRHAGRCARWIALSWRAVPALLVLLLIGGCGGTLPAASAATRRRRYPAA
jgi:hypothetical protein